MTIFDVSAQVLGDGPAQGNLTELNLVEDSPYDLSWLSSSDSGGDTPVIISSGSDSDLSIFDDVPGETLVVNFVENYDFGSSVRGRGRRGRGRAAARGYSRGRRRCSRGRGRSSAARISNADLVRPSTTVRTDARASGSGSIGLSSIPEGYTAEEWRVIRPDFVDIGVVVKEEISDLPL